jgi:hypothetical protein
MRVVRPGFIPGTDHYHDGPENDMRRNRLVQMGGNLAPNVAVEEGTFPTSRRRPCRWRVTINGNRLGQYSNRIESS